VTPTTSPSTIWKNYKHLGDSLSKERCCVVKPSARAHLYRLGHSPGSPQDLGYDGPPFPWSEALPAILGAQPDGWFFHVYRLPRDELDNVMGTSTGLVGYGTKRSGEYRSNRLLLDGYDAMAEVASKGGPLVLSLDRPPAGDGSRHGPSSRSV
jgi:hypothetical protein